MWNIHNFPPDASIETKKVLKKATQAHRYLAELKGLAKSIPNESILLNTLSLQEAKDSSEIENIITTHADLFKADRNVKSLPPATKEVYRYADALLVGFEQVSKRQFITLNHIKEMHSVLSGSVIGFRKQPGTKLMNDQTGEIIYVPPQSPTEIENLLNDLEAFINEDTREDFDDLTKMAIIHHQFESIHPFPDGNGRTGRILNMLCLVQSNLIEIPILYLSRYITSTKSEYYRLLQDVRDNSNWEDWLIYLLEGIAVTAKHTIEIVKAMKNMMQETKQRIRTSLPKIYSQDLLNIIFRHPYTKIQNVVDDLKVTRKTASKYLEALAEERIVSREKIGRTIYYINHPLTRLFIDIPLLTIDDD